MPSEHWGMIISVHACKGEDHVYGFYKPTVAFWSPESSSPDLLSFAWHPVSSCNIYSGQ